MAIEMGLPNRCPWTDLITSAVSVFIPFPISSPSLPPYLYFAFSVSSQINNSALITFSPLVPDLLHLYANLEFLHTLSFIWYYRHGYLVGLQMYPILPLDYLWNWIISHRKKEIVIFIFMRRALNLNSHIFFIWISMGCPEILLDLVRSFL